MIKSGFVYNKMISCFGNVIIFNLNILIKSFIFQQCIPLELGDEKIDKIRRMIGDVDFVRIKKLRLYLFTLKRNISHSCIYG